MPVAPAHRPRTHSLSSLTLLLLAVRSNPPSTIVGHAGPRPLRLKASRSGVWVEVILYTDLVVTRDLDAHVPERLAIQGNRAIETHLGAQAAVGRWIQLRTFGAVHDYEITLRLKAGRQSPLYFLRIEYIHLFVHDEDVFDVEAVGKCGEDRVFPLSFYSCLDGDDRVVATRAARGRVHRPDGRHGLAHRLEQARLTRDTPEQEMLVAGRNDRMEDRVVAVGDRGNLHDLFIAAWSIVLRVLAEGALRLAYVRGDRGLGNDLGVGWHVDVHCLAPHDRQGLLAQ